MGPFLDKLRGNGQDNRPDDRYDWLRGRQAPRAEETVVMSTRLKISKASELVEILDARQARGERVTMAGLVSEAVEDWLKREKKKAGTRGVKQSARTSDQDNMGSPQGDLDPRQGAARAG